MSTGPSASTRASDGGWTPTSPSATPSGWSSSRRTHSACSVAFGKGVTTGEPGSVQRLILAVDDIDAARADLVRRGIEVSGLFHLAGGPVPGPDPEGRSYQTYASFSDPDGNGWLLQEIKTRLPGREW